METLTANQFKERYGGIAASAFDQEKKKDSLFASIKNDIIAHGQNNQDIYNQYTSKKDQSLGNSVEGGFKLAANTAGGVGAVAGDVLSHTPVVGPVVQGIGGAIKGGFDAVTGALGKTKFFQEAAAGLPEGNNLEKGLSVASSGGEIAGNILGADVGLGAARGAAVKAATIPSKVEEVAGSIPKPNLGAAGDYMKGAVRDVVPTKQNWIDSALASGLDLTPGDLKNIEFSTGNPVGKWMADNNLIGTNKVTTEGLVSGFFKTNYDAVRSEIAKVATIFKPYQVPRYTDALTAIQAQIKDTVGLEKENALVDNLLHKTDLTLEDVQKVKEMLDEHFNLYKVTGDVGQGVAKEGLANVRQDLKTFIENAVQQTTGADIRQMNNNVQTARGLTDAIQNRSTRGITRAHITWRDAAIGMGLTYFGSPVLGLGAVLVQKVLSSSSVQLRLARYLDKLSDAERAKVSQDLMKGVVPAEVKKIIPLESN